MLADDVHQRLKVDWFAKNPDRGKARHGRRIERCHHGHGNCGQAVSLRRHEPVLNERKPNTPSVLTRKTRSTSEWTSNFLAQVESLFAFLALRGGIGVRDLKVRHGPPGRGPRLANELRDPIHGFVGTEDIERDIIDSPIFQRLRKIRQLALASLVYPGAVHSRFEHSIGAMHVAGSIAARLGLTPQEARIVRLAALLHDIGHGPFSHVSEPILQAFASCVVGSSLPAGRFTNCSRQRSSRKKVA